MPRVAKAEVDRRREKLAELLQRERYLRVADVAERLGVSEVTARRDLSALNDQQRIQRTHGGAVSPDALEYERTFASFGKRRTRATAAKTAIATAAATLIEPGMTVFLDAGTTCFRVAEELRRTPPVDVTVVTQSLAVATHLAAAEEASVVLLGGRLLPRQKVVLGPQTLAATRQWTFDLALLGAEAFNDAGIFNSQQDVADLQREVMARAGSHAFLLDATKLGHSSSALVTSWTDIDTLVTNATADALAALPIERHQLQLVS
ncbi:MAG: DeoR/GlpR family DNA-binding transcription regulator [Planctomycetota bacterium]